MDDSKAKSQTSQAFWSTTRSLLPLRYLTTHSLAEQLIAMRTVHRITPAAALQRPRKTRSTWASHEPSSLATIQPVHHRSNSSAHHSVELCRTTMLMLLLLVYLADAANPVQVGLRSAAVRSPLLSRWVTRRSSPPSTRLSSSPSATFLVSSTAEEDELEDDSVVQSAFWLASSPAHVYQTRQVEFPVSRQSAPSAAHVAPECELEFIESQIQGGHRGSVLASTKAGTVTARAPPSPSLALTPPPGRHRQHAPSPSSSRHHATKQESLAYETTTNDSSDTEEFATTTTSLAEDVRGGVAAARPLLFWETMVAGAVSRSVAQTIMHPANTMKTMLQSSSESVTVRQLLKPSSFRRLTYGAGANFVLSFPTGAMNFAVLEFVRHHMGQIVQSNPFLSARQEQLGAGLDFVSSAISTIACSVVSTPQMMITDNIMAGQYANMVHAAKGLHAAHGLSGFYRGWWPGLVGKIPSYALTWTLFQQLKQAQTRICRRPARNYENSIMGCLASATTVCIMIPMDTIKTRLVTQAGGVAVGRVPYKGIIDCAVRVAKEEGIGAFYRGLPPRLISVVPMIGIQFGVYEAMKKVMLSRRIEADRAALSKRKRRMLEEADKQTDEEKFEEVAMEVGASHGNPMPVPHMHDHEHFAEQQKKFKKKAQKKTIREKAKLKKH